MSLDLSALPVCLHATEVLAEVQTFNVDLFGISDLGHEMSVFGTISLDPNEPVGSAITMSSLQFQHLADSPIHLPSIPTASTDAPSQLGWNVVGGDLYMNRLGENDSVLVWDFGPLSGSFILTSGFGDDHGHQLVLPIFGECEIVSLKPPSGPDGPTGFLVGTLSVPEPSPEMFMPGFRAAFSMRSRR